MNFKEAYDKLSEIAPGQFRKVEYSITENSYGGKTQHCSLYVHNYNHAYSDTWDGAFEKLAVMMGHKVEGEDIVIDDVEEIGNEQNT